MIAAFVLFANAASFVRAAKITATGISISFFDERGKPTHKLLASEGAATGAVQHLREVEIVYFAANEPRRIVQRVEADAATWDEKKQTLDGAGRVLVATEENRITGNGFHFALATSRLDIHRDFKMENRELVLTSDRAVVDLIVEKSGDELKVRDVKRSEAIGNLRILVQPTAKKAYQFDEAFSEIAVYESATQTVSLPRPVRYAKNGQPVGGSNTTTIWVGEKPADKK